MTQLLLLFASRAVRRERATGLRVAHVRGVVAVTILYAMAYPHLSLADDATPFSQLLSVRRAIVSGHVVLTIEGKQVVFDESGRNPLEKRYAERAEIWFDGDNLRGDWTTRSGGETVVSCFGCAGEGTHVYYDNSVLPGGKKVALSVTEDNAINPPKDAVPHPRWAGIAAAPFRLTTYFDPEAILGSSYHHTSESLQDGTHRISWVNDRSGKYEVRLRNDPPGIEHLVMTYEHDGKAYVETLAVENKVHSVNSIELLYPQRIQFRQTINGDIVREETVRVNEANFNAPDPVVFSLARITGLLPGTPVHWALPRDRPAPNAPLEWNGVAIVGVHSGQADQGAMGPREVTRSSIRNLVIAANVMILALFVVAWITRRIRIRNR